MVMPVDSAARRWEMSVDEWTALPAEEKGELVDGVLVEEEVSDFVHEVVVAWLLRVLGNWIAPSGGVVAGSDAKLALAEGRGRKPDVTLYLPTSPKPPRRGPVRTPPDLVVEVISPDPRDGRRDRVEKPDDYAAFGIRWYLILDPETRVLECYELDERRRYVRVRAASEGRVSIAGLDGLELDLDALWSETDRLSAE